MKYEHLRLTPFPNPTAVKTGKLNYVEAKNDIEGEDEVAERKEYAAKLLEMAATEQGLIKIRSDCGVDLEQTKKLFEYFVELCLVHMIEKKNWKLFKAVKPISDIFTAADEALALVLFENNAEEWKMIVEEQEVNTKSRKRKFTHRKSGSPGNSERSKGWVMAGIRRYNTLLETVMNNRRIGVEGCDSWRWELELRTNYNSHHRTSGGQLSTSASSDTTGDDSDVDERVFAIDLFELDDEDRGGVGNYHEL